MPLGCFRNGAGTKAMSPKLVPPKLPTTAYGVPVASVSARSTIRSSSSAGIGVNSSRLSVGSRASSSMGSWRTMVSK